MDNDFKISDISVSRTHAELVKSNGELFIHDKNSKFGTLVLLRKSLALIPASSSDKNDKTNAMNATNTNIDQQIQMSQVKIQVGRTLFDISIANGYLNKIQSFCCSRTIPPQTDYFYEVPGKKKSALIEPGQL